MAFLSTYIAFPGNAKEAFEYYHQVFGGDLTIITYGDMANMEGAPAVGNPNYVAHAQLDIPGGAITGSDGDRSSKEEYPLTGTAYSLLYCPNSIAKAKDLIAQLVEDGGKEQRPFQPAPWGSHYGQIFDKFGVMWAFNV